jgi:ApaG protein
MNASTMNALFPHSTRTRDVTVRVSVSFLADQSEPARGHWFWAYHIRIENDGKQPVQLMTRHWTITDGRGARHEVHGDGVVGEQPVIAPGESYDYVSGCPLHTPTGAMEGSYHMVVADGSSFDAAIPRFPLIGPAVAR